MAIVNFQDCVVEVGQDQSLLDALLDAGKEIPHGCKAGACQSCLVQVTEGEIPGNAQNGLKETQKQQGYILSCQCHPQQDMRVEMSAEASSIRALVNDKHLESTNILRLWLDSELDYRPGQFVNLIREDGLTRSYSIASVPELDSNLEFHIRLHPDGQFSNWAGSELKPGEELLIQGPYGDCFYSTDNKVQPMLLAGIGTGLAPLYGIVRDALEQGHQGPIHLFTGARTTGNLYLLDELQSLSKRYPHFSYTPVVLEADQQEQEEIEGLSVGDLNQVVKDQFADLNGYAVYLCGSEQRVNSLRKQAFLCGASMKEIFYDLFVPASAA